MQCHNTNRIHNATDSMLFYRLRQILLSFYWQSEAITNEPATFFPLFLCLFAFVLLVGSYLRELLHIIRVLLLVFPSRFRDIIEQKSREMHIGIIFPVSEARGKINTQIDSSSERKTHFFCM